MKRLISNNCDQMLYLQVMVQICRNYAICDESGNHTTKKQLKLGIVDYSHLLQNEQTQFLTRFIRGYCRVEDVTTRYYY